MVYVTAAASVFMTVFAFAFVNNAQAGPADSYYAGEEKVNALLSAPELYQWIKNGYKTPDGKRVIIIDIAQDESFVPFYEGDVEALKEAGMSWAGYADREGFLGHIPGAQLFISHEAGGHIGKRNDGPMIVEHQMGNEKTINTFMQNQGITRDSVVVLTAADLTSPPYCVTRPFATLRYWGMSINNLRVLDGANIGWVQYIKQNHAAEFSALGLRKGAPKEEVKPSTLQVRDFPKRFFETRATLGDVFKTMDEGRVARGEVMLLDNRPFSPLFIKDISKFASSIKGSVLPLPAGKDGAAGFDPKEFSPLQTTDSNMGLMNSKQGPIPFIAGPKAEAFDGQLRGANLVKGKTAKGELYDIGAGSFFNFVPLKDDAGKPVFMLFGTYKKPADVATPAPWAKKASVEAMFQRLFPDKNQEIIVSCNSGAWASIHHFFLSQVLGYKQAKIYDGSQMEWGNLAAFEPNDKNPQAALRVVRPDVYTWLPTPPSNMPAMAALASEAHPFQVNKRADGKYVALDEVTGETCVVDAADCWIKTGGTLHGNTKWDTVSRSQHVLFRPSARVNTGVRGKRDDVLKTVEYNKSFDWAEVKVFPDYSGEANLTSVEDGKTK